MRDKKIQNFIEFNENKEDRDDLVYVNSQPRTNDPNHKEEVRDDLAYANSQPRTGDGDSKYQVGDTVIIKDNLDDLIGTYARWQKKGDTQISPPKHPQFKQYGSYGMNDFLGREAKIEYVVNADHESNDRSHLGLDDLRYSRYLLDIDNGDYWWVDECFVS